ncbi:MAG: site-specific integrase [Burkholderiaceae bacterium]|nr:site-specific integrase [Burkholderiaceae bacterium]
MGNITQRKRRDGSAAYTAQIRIMEDGKTVLSEAKTFDRRALAAEWMRRREGEIQAERASGVATHKRVTIEQILKNYVKSATGLTDWGRSKTSDIKKLMASGLAAKDATRLTVQDVIGHVMMRRTVDGVSPATALNDVVWLRQALLHARSESGLTHPVEVIDQAKHELMRQRIIQKSRSRIRRLDPKEEAALLEFFGQRDVRSTIEMVPIMRFALATARRQEEICKLRLDDVDFEKGIAWLDDVKHPRLKTGNRRAFRLVSAAAEIIRSRPISADGRVFPYNSKSVGSAFTKACHLLEIPDLHFHDLRHEATSRLFERGYSIQEVAQFTLHDSWATLQRYTHLRPEQVKER